MKITHNYRKMKDSCKQPNYKHKTVHSSNISNQNLNIVYNLMKSLISKIKRANVFNTRYQQRKTEIEISKFNKKIHFFFFGESSVLSTQCVKYCFLVHLFYNYSTIILDSIRVRFTSTTLFLSSLSSGLFFCYAEWRYCTHHFHLM